MVPSTPQGGTWGDNRRDREEGRKEEEDRSQGDEGCSGTAEKPRLRPSSLTGMSPVLPHPHPAINTEGTEERSDLCGEHTRSLEPAPALGLNQPLREA